MGFFDISFWQQLTTTFVGAVAGVGTAFWANNHLHKKERDQAAEEVAARKRQLQEAIIDTLSHNLHLLKPMKAEVATTIIFYNANLSLLASTSALKYEVLEDIGLCKQLDRLYYELGHLHRKVELHMTVFFDHPDRSNHRQFLAKAIDSHIPLIQGLVAPVLEKMKQETGYAPPATERMTAGISTLEHADG